jgi:hypothetical protein
VKSRQSTSASLFARLFARLLKGEDPAVLAKSLLREIGEPESFHRPIATRSWAWRGLVSFCGPAKEARGLGTSVPYITSAPRERAYIGECLAFAGECLR